MGTLEKIMQFQQEGYSDEEIISHLKGEGISPSEIENSLNQAKIKSAVSQPGNINGMEPSMTNLVSPEPTQQVEQLETQQPEMDGAYENYDTNQQYYEGNYGQERQSAEVITEIAEQIVNEKFEKYKKRTGDIVRYKNETNDKLSDLDDRLKRIEESIEQLQRDIIKRIGEFGDSNNLVHRDLENLHGTMSKMMNPLVDNYNELKKLNEPTHKKPIHHIKKHSIKK